jgi:hypothetical protein
MPHPLQKLHLLTLQLHPQMQYHLRMKAQPLRRLPMQRPRRMKPLQHLWKLRL